MLCMEYQDTGTQRKGCAGKGDYRRQYFSQHFPTHNLICISPKAANAMAKRAMKLLGTFESLNVPIPAQVAKKLKKERLSQILQRVHRVIR